MNKIHDLRVGDKFSINLLDKYGNIKSKQQWKVTDIYPYFIIAERGKERRSFNLGELVRYGVIGQSNKHLQRLVDEANTPSRTWLKYA